jgi:hypothetical protein
MDIADPKRPDFAHPHGGLGGNKVHQPGPGIAPFQIEKPLGFPSFQDTPIFRSASRPENCVKINIPRSKLRGMFFPTSYMNNSNCLFSYFFSYSSGLGP